MNREFAAINWLFMYMDQMVAPFNMITDAIRKLKPVSALGISCAPAASQAANDQEESWSVVVDWLAAPCILRHSVLLRILDFMARTQIFA